MSAIQPIAEKAEATPVPRLLVELPSRQRVFVGNLRDLVFPRPLPALELQSSPADFWPDVLVHRPPAWGSFLQSCGYHLVAVTLLISATRFFAMQPRVVAKPAFEHSQVVYSQAEYLPPLDTRRESSAAPQKADPEFARQTIISVPPEADNREQTIVAPPSVKLKQHIALPNIVAWSEVEKPKLAIPAAPIIPAAEISRIPPSLQSSLVAPPPEMARVEQRRNAPMLQSSAVAPPPEVSPSRAPSRFEGLQAPLIAPPPAIDGSTARPLGDLDIARSAVIAPAPQLPLAAQRTASAGSLAGAGTMPQVVAPPPSASGSALSETSAGTRGRMIALNLHPTIGAPPDSAAGNRRGAFAATPEGHAGASGNPGSVSGTGTSEGTSATAKKTNDLPSGLYVGKAASGSTVAGDPAGARQNSVNPNLLASARPPRASTATSPQPGNAARLSDAERAVFAGRKFYSLTLNMPNLNSAGGSWVIRFAELNRTALEANAASDLSAPHATRKVDPAYPIQLMRENVAGTVIVYAVIHADGTVGNVRVLQGADERLDRFAAQAVAQWKFDPATKNGAPVDVEATFQIPFRPTRFGSNF